MKTTLEWLEEIPDLLVREQAINNYTLQQVTDMSPVKDSLKDAVMSAFVHDRTEEGLEYWAEFVGTL